MQKNTPHQQNPQLFATQGQLIAFDRSIEYSTTSWIDIRSLSGEIFSYSVSDLYCLGIGGRWVVFSWGVGSASTGWGGRFH